MWRSVVNAARKATRRPLVEVAALADPPLIEPPGPRDLSPSLARLPERQRLSAAPAVHQALFIVPSDGGTPPRITSWTLDAGGANWSPDAGRILFQSYRDCPCSQTSQVYTIAPDGSRVGRLTSLGSNIEPNWSPDGKKIVYAHQPFVGARQLPDLWSMRADGSDKRPVIRTNRWDSEPDWGTAPPTNP